MKIAESLKKWRRTDRGWPRYLPGGRIRTSTAGLIAAFIALSWLSQIYDPPAPPPAVPDTAVVPPGFVPDPEYTWVPRTQVVRPRATTPTTTTTTTPTTTPTEPTEPTEPTDPGGMPTSPNLTPPTTTVVDPDGPAGLIPPITLPVLPGSAPTPTPQTTASPPPPARSAN
ncbi:MAG: hypothetical protein WBV64_11250 [Mycobacterium sp.]|jgi:hypothetical protein